jgi:hypothetical protein
MLGRSSSSSKAQPRAHFAQRGDQVVATAAGQAGPVADRGEAPGQGWRCGFLFVHHVRSRKGGGAQKKDRGKFRILRAYRGRNGHSHLSLPAYEHPITLISYSVFYFHVWHFLEKGVSWRFNSKA